MTWGLTAGTPIGASCEGTGGGIAIRTWAMEGKIVPTPNLLHCQSKAETLAYENEVPGLHCVRRDWKRILTVELQKTPPKELQLRYRSRWQDSLGTVILARHMSGPVDQGKP